MKALINYNEELEKAGFTNNQAKTSLKIGMEIMNQNFIAKVDFEEFARKVHGEHVSIRSDIKDLANKVDNHFIKTEAKLEVFESKLNAFEFKIDALENRILRKQTAITSAILTFFYLLQNYFHH